MAQELRAEPRKSPRKPPLQTQTTCTHPGTLGCALCTGQNLDVLAPSLCGPARRGGDRMTTVEKNPWDESAGLSRHFPPHSVQEALDKAPCRADEEASEERTNKRQKTLSENTHTHECAQVTASNGCGWNTGCCNMHTHVRPKAQVRRADPCGQLHGLLRWDAQG